MTASMQYRLHELLQDQSLRAPGQLRRRIEALDWLESRLFHADGALAPALRQRTEGLAAELEAINRCLYRAIRHDIRQGKGASILLEWATALRDHDENEHYDSLDALIGGVMDFREPGEVNALDAGMVFYQPTPARQLFDFIARASPDERDVVMDLGSGLGHVALLTSICTGARCIGIEREATYVASARQCADALNVRNVLFLAQDVRDADLSQGTLFYLYTPFTGALLRSVLDMLRREAASRVIRLCTLGPCTPTVAAEPWLEAEGACQPDRIALFRSFRPD